MLYFFVRGECMKIYDISQELLNSKVYPGDPKPDKKILSDMSKGDLYNLTEIIMCAHNGTHIDAPLHFINEGTGVDKIPLKKFVGPCCVLTHNGDFTSVDADALKAKYNGDMPKRVLIKGNVTVTSDGAKALAKENIYLIGNESQTVGPNDAPMEVHKILLSKQVVLLEGVRLDQVDDGNYFLCAQPINIASGDGSPCRAILIDFESE